jgi:hypothetical protein
VFHTVTQYEDLIVPRLRGFTPVYNDYLVCARPKQIGLKAQTARDRYVDAEASANSDNERDTDVDGNDCHIFIDVFATDESKVIASVKHQVSSIIPVFLEIITCLAVPLPLLSTIHPLLILPFLTSLYQAKLPLCTAVNRLHERPGRWLPEPLAHAALWNESMLTHCT